MQRIVIIGAGMAGLTVALALQRMGYTVSVYEQASEIREIGAGVVITPNGKRALDHLGIGQIVADGAASVDTTHVRHYGTGEVLRELSRLAVIEQQGQPVLFVHRADLHAALYEAVRMNDPDAVHAGKRFLDCKQNDDEVQVKFEDGSTIVADLLIGADGNASGVRSAVFAPETPRFTGQVAMRALVPSDLVPPAIWEHPNSLFIGPNRLFLYYPLRGGSLLNVIAIGRAAQWEEEGWAIPASNEEFKALNSDFHPDIHSLIEAVPPHALFKWGLRDREPLAEWSKGRIVVLGDAAHPISPFLGQGANIAIEDGLVLARCLQAFSSFEEAFERYQLARKERGTNVQMWSREQADALEGNTSLGFHPGRNAGDRGLYDYDPVTSPI